MYCSAKMCMFGQLTTIMKFTNHSRKIGVSFPLQSDFRTYKCNLCDKRHLPGCVIWHDIQKLTLEISHNYVIYYATKHFHYFATLLEKTENGSCESSVTPPAIRGQSGLPGHTKTSKISIRNLRHCSLSKDDKTWD